MSYWHGDEWRWFSRPATAAPTISVIEPPSGEEKKPTGRRAPFGFAREFVPDPPPERDPYVWEGED